MGLFLYRDGELSSVEATTFAQSQVRERQDLQTALKKNIGAISDDLLVISEEFSSWSKGQRSIDLLAIDKDANIVVIELKRTETGDHMELQALRYASMISNLTWQEAVEIYKKFLDKNAQSSTDYAEGHLCDFLEWEKPKEDDFGQMVRIVLVSANFSTELTSSVIWLNNIGLDIQCYQIKPYKHAGGSSSNLLINVQQIIPLPEAEDYQIKVKRKAQETQRSRTSNRDFSKYEFKNEQYNKRKLVLAVIKEWVEKNKPNNLDELTQVFPQNLRSGGIFAPLNEADRHFTEPADVITLGNEEKYAVSTQWGGKPHEKFIAIARSLGYEITKVT